MNSAAHLRDDLPHAGLGLLGRSSPQEYDIAIPVEGRLPADLAGTLYRNGPGLFERGGVRKRHLLDGDGYIQSVQLGQHPARYRSRFVRTSKFVAEAAADAYLFPTWSTLAPGGIMRNLGNRIRSQAGVAITARDGRLYAFDDAGLPWEIEPQSLQTVGEVEPATALGLPSYNAHNRIDGGNGDWIQFGLTHGRHTTAHVAIRDKHGQARARYAVPLERATYVHDFFVTEHYIVFLVHALEFRPLAMLAGLKSFIDCLHWTPALGNHLLVVERLSGRQVKRYDAPACFMWHALNAYEADGEIVADFVGYDAPDHFIGTDAEFANIMRGRRGRAECPGTLRRYRMPLAGGPLVCEVISGASYEFPSVAATEVARRHRYGYFARGFSAATNLQSGIARVDLDSGAEESFDFGAGCHAGEPVYVAGAEGGYLLSMVLDGPREESFVAVFRAAAPADGPLARIPLGMPTPLSFHGCWVAA